MLHPVITVGLNIFKRSEKYGEKAAYHRIGGCFFFFLLFAIFLSGCGNNTAKEKSEAAEASYMKITAEEAKELMDSGEEYILLDVREQEEFDEGHIEGAVLIPYGSIEERAEKELPDREQTILLYCRSGRRSGIAAEALAKMGYTDVRDFGGMIDWPYDVVR